MDLSFYVGNTFKERISFEDYKGNVYSFKQVDEIANHIAFLLSEKGIKSGDYISVFSNNKAMELILFFASLKIGSILVPHNLKLSRSEILREMDIVKSKLAIFSKTVDGEILDIKNDINIESMFLEDLESKTSKIFKSNEIDIERTAIIIFTGGTTGIPKGAKISLRAILFNSFNTIITWKLSDNDSTVLAYPLYHTGGWNVLTLPLYITGGKTIFIEKFKPEIIMEIIDKKKITTLSAVPAIFLEMVNSEDFKFKNLNSLRFVKSGGGMSSPQVVNAFLSKGIKFYQGYGLTEAGPNLFYSDEEDLKRNNSIGRKSLFVDLKLIDEEGKESYTGELYVYGPVIYSGYIGNEEKVEFVKTGDILERDNDGFYYFKGRKKFMYKSGGENIYPTEIENVLEKHPDIIECAVIGVPDEKWGEVGKAFIVSRKKIAEDEIKKYLLKYIARYKIPKYFVFVSQIPKTPAGKKDYLKLGSGEYEK
ncbi:MAG: class I adenylate-forming enzyme family protein [Thermoplasmata archaeon]